MKQWYLLFAAGLIAVVGGVFALFNPMEATLAATRILAWVFIIAGALQIVAVFGDLDLRARIWTTLLGALAIGIGLWIMGNPVGGAVALTWTIGLLFLLEGVVKIVLAFAARGIAFFWTLLLTGAVSVLLAGVILARFPASALAVPGILLAIDLISTGAAVMALALHFKTPRTA